jgi:hypothetical protein
MHALRKGLAMLTPILLKKLSSALVSQIPQTVL